MLYLVSFVQSKENSHPPSLCGGWLVCQYTWPGSPPLELVVKSSGRDCAQALGSVLSLSLKHMLIHVVLSNPVLPSSAPGRYKWGFQGHTFKFVPVISEAWKVSVLAIVYCDQVDLLLLLSISSAVVLVKIEALKVTQIKVTFHANHKVAFFHISPNDMWLSLLLIYVLW